MSLDTRLARLRAVMGEYDALIATAPENVRYVTSLCSMDYYLYGITPMFAVIGRTGPPEIVAAAADLAWVEQQTNLDHVHAHGRFYYYGDAAEVSRALSRGLTLENAALEALEAAGGGRRIGIDDSLYPSRFSALSKALEPRSLEVVPDIFLSARRIKDEDEIANMRAANLITEKALYGAMQQIRPGVTERQISTWIRQEMIALGAQPMLMAVGIAERGALVDTWPSDRSVRIGEPIRFDLGCVYNGYHSDLSRTAVLGDPPDWLIRDYAAIVAGVDAAVAATRPGVVAGELFDITMEATRAAGIPDYERTGVGHGIGLSLYEIPYIIPGNQTVLEVGMTLCLETPYYTLGKAGIQVEDAVVVTDTGCEHLGNASRDLVRLEMSGRNRIHVSAGE